MMDGYTYSSADYILLHLSLIEGVGPGTVEKIMSGIAPESLDALYTWQSEDFRARGCSREISTTLVEGLANKSIIDHECELLKKHGFSFVSLLHPLYPELLRSIALPPIVLYVYGTPVWHKKETIAFVGSRKANTYGKQAVTVLVPELVHQGWVTISGGAYGIDAAVHAITVEIGGATVAILGSGLLRPYPTDHKKLFDKIVASGGAVVSSFSLETAPHPGNFPARNRIISGMSKGTVVVQAAEKSGALITAHYALEQGRSVFAVPGSITDSLSRGCHALLKNGARLVVDPQDIMDEYGISQYRQTTLLPLADEAQLIISHLHEPKSMDELRIATGLQETALNHYLFELQLNGYVEQNFIGLWQRA